MPPAAEPPATRHAAQHTLLLQTALIAGAAGGWLWFAATGDQPPRLLACSTASVFSTLAIAYPVFRLLAARTIAASNWAIERRRGNSQQRAAKHAEAWRAIVVTATEGIVTIDKHGHIETVNAAAQRMFGYSESQLLGRNVKMLMPPPYQKEHDEYLRRYLRTGERRIIGIGREVVGLRKDGTRFPIDLSVGEGTLEGRPFFTAVLRDITDRKELQAKLAQTERLAAIGELAAGVAHEINNPLNTMMNCTQLIRDGDDSYENIQIVSEECERIAEIVRDLLEFARDERDHAVPTQLSEAVQRTERLIGANWRRHGITLTVDVPTDLPTVRGRAKQLQQVLLNLLINAKQALATVPSGERRVWVDARAEHDGVRCFVRDNGPGIDPSVEDRVFEPFVTTKQELGGSGLGLAISRSIVQGYGGQLRVEPNTDAGATFSFWLPTDLGE